MQISDLVTDFNKKTKTTIGSSYQASDFLVDVNAAYDRVASLILKADSRWQWDDFNNTDLPIATTNIVSGQQDYSLAITHLTIDRVEILDSGGLIWHELDPVTQQSLKRGAEVALEEYIPTEGTPIKYMVVGNSIFLYGIPNYNMTAGLKLYFTRGPNYFVIGDISSNAAIGTKIPGFNQLFHQLLSLWPSYDYCITNLPDLAPGYMTKIQLLEADINDFYGLRFHDQRPKFTVSTNQGGGAQSGVLGTGGGDSNK